MLIQTSRNMNHVTCPHLSTPSPVHALTCPPAVTVCVSGAVFGLSYRTRIDEDNCVALMPNGNVSFSFFLFVN